MENVKDLRGELIEVFSDLKANKIKLLKAKELTNCAGKILLTAKIELIYNQYLDKKSPIAFLE